jgi:methionine-rich copper-binding protein CopC
MKEKPQMKPVWIRRWSAAAALGLMLAAPSLPAYAHAELLETVPASQASTTAPKELRLTFSESIELSFAEVTLKGDDDRPIAVERLSLAPYDNKTMVITVATDLPAGAYTVDWSLISADDHRIEGSYSFDVAP